MRIKVAVATKGSKGLEDRVSEVFGRSKTFTIVEIENGSIKKVKTIENPAATYEYGAGPIATKTLIDMGVEVVAAAEFGVGISSLLKSKNIRAIEVEARTNVRRAIDIIISKTYKVG